MLWCSTRRRGFWFMSDPRVCVCTCLTPLLGCCRERTCGLHSGNMALERLDAPAVIREVNNRCSALGDLKQ